MRHLFLIRHGSTEAVEKHLMHGATDSPLSDLGFKEALLTSEALKDILFKAAFSSPMVRALETARAIIKPHPGVGIIQLNTLREMNFGFYEYKPYFASPDEVPHGNKKVDPPGKSSFRSGNR
jgi:broad specificity phosphatase PhoE